MNRKTLFVIVAVNLILIGITNILQTRRINKLENKQKQITADIGDLDTRVVDLRNEMNVLQNTIDSIMGDAE